MDLLKQGSKPTRQGNWVRVTSYAPYVLQDANTHKNMVLYQLENGALRKIEDISYEQMSAINSSISMGFGLFFDTNAKHFSVGGW